MNWVERFNRFYYKWAYWPFVAAVAFGALIVVGTFIDEPHFTLEKLREFLFLILAVVFSANYTRERRAFLRSLKALGPPRSTAGQQR